MLLTKVLVSLQLLHYYNASALPVSGSTHLVKRMEKVRVAEVSPTREAVESSVQREAIIGEHGKLPDEKLGLTEKTDGDTRKPFDKSMVYGRSDDIEPDLEDYFKKDGFRYKVFSNFNQGLTDIIVRAILEYSEKARDNEEMENTVKYTDQLHSYLKKYGETYEQKVIPLRLAKKAELEAIKNSSHGLEGNKKRD